LQHLFPRQGGGGYYYCGGFENSGNAEGRLKEDPDADTSFESDEVLKLAPGSLAVSGIDKILTVKELIDSIINGAEDILKSGVFAGIRG